MKRSERARDRRRIDVLLVERGLAPSREKAQALVLAGVVSAGGRPVAKPGALVPPDADLHLAPRRRFVSRGGEKLDGALSALGLDVAGIEALDVGASTGGFTDCLLQKGARRVVALDVGRGQLDWTLRTDPRVTVIEGVNARYLDGALARPSPADDRPIARRLPPEHRLEAAAFDLIVVDVSFISLRLVIPALVPYLRKGATERPVAAPLPALLALVKPQFELGRGSVGRGGIVREAAKHLEAILKVVSPGSQDHRASAAGDAASSAFPPLGVWAILESPIRGAEGNREFFVLLVPGHDRSMQSIEDEARRVAIVPDEDAI